MARLARGESTGPVGYQKYMVYSEDIWEMRKLKPYLCAMACPGGKRTDDVVAETCRKCGNCGYGKQFVKLFDRQKGAERVATAKKAVDEATLQEQLEQKTAQLEKARKEANDAKTQLEQKTKENKSLTVRLEAQEKKTKELAEALTIKARENEELSEHITQMSKGLQDLGRKLEAAEAREKESSHEMKVMALQIIRLKAEIYDLEHEDED